MSDNPGCDWVYDKLGRGGGARCGESLTEHLAPRYRDHPYVERARGGPAVLTLRPATVASMLDPLAAKTREVEEQRKRAERAEGLIGALEIEAEVYADCVERLKSENRALETERNEFKNLLAEAEAQIRRVEHATTHRMNELGAAKNRTHSKETHE